METRCFFFFLHSFRRLVVDASGIAGGSGAGKSTLARKLYDSLGGAQNVTYLVHDSYYRDLSDQPIATRALTNFDHPDSLETELLVQHIRELKRGKVVEAPVYDFVTHTRVCRTKSVELHGPRPILLVEGILILCYPQLANEMDLKVFVVSEASPNFLIIRWEIYADKLLLSPNFNLFIWKDAAPDIRLIRRLSRDCGERGRTTEQVVTQYQSTVRPMHEQYVEPSKQIADLIVHSSVAAEQGSPHTIDVACEVLKNHLQVTAGLIGQRPALASVEDQLRVTKILK